jgi:hypothetical protein
MKSKVRQKISRDDDREQYPSASPTFIPSWIDPLGTKGLIKPFGELQSDGGAHGRAKLSYLDHVVRRDVIELRSLVLMEYGLVTLIPFGQQK